MKNKEENECGFCDGSGFIEKTITYRDEDSGQEITEETGELERCFNCNVDL